MYEPFLVFVLFHLLTASNVAEDSLKEHWSKQNLTYSFFKYPTKISREDTLAAFKNIFDQWSTIVPKTFTNLPENHTEANFKISFKPMNGKIYDVQRNGNITINDDENWKYYKVGEKVDPQTLDLTFAAQDLISFVLRGNNVTANNSVSLSKNYTDSDGNYVLPKVVKLS